MLHPWKSLLSYGSLPLVIVLVFEAGACGAEPTLDAIYQQYAVNQKQLRQVFVHWRSSVELVEPDSGAYASEDCHAAIKDEKRYYDIQLTPVSGPPLPKELTHRAMTYDGQETRILMSADNVRIFPGDERRQFDAPDDFLALQGYPKSDYRVRIEATTVSCDMATLLSSGEYRPAGVKEVEGAACVQVVGVTDRICFDPGRGFAVLQREVLDRNSGNVRVRYAFRDLAEVQKGIWLAREIVSECFKGSRVKSRWQLRVAELKFEEVSDGMFSLKFEPGKVVEDMTHTARDAQGKWPVVMYKVPAKPEDLDKVVAAAVEAQPHLRVAGEPVWVVSGGATDRKHRGASRVCDRFQHLQGSPPGK